MNARRYGVGTTREFAVFLWVSLLLIGIVASSGIAMVLCLPTWSDRAAFGSMFGAANAVVASLALAGVIVTLRMQMSEIRAERRRVREASRLSALAILIPILRNRVEGTTQELRSSHGFQRLIESVDELEAELERLVLEGH